MVWTWDFFPSFETENTWKCDSCTNQYSTVSLQGAMFLWTWDRNKNRGKMRKEQKKQGKEWVNTSLLWKHHSVLQSEMQQWATNKHQPQMNSLNSSKFSCCANVINCSHCLQTFQPQPKLCGELRGRCVFSCIPEQRNFLLTTAEPDLTGTHKKMQNVTLLSSFPSVFLCFTLIYYMWQRALSLEINQA